MGVDRRRDPPSLLSLIQASYYFFEGSDLRGEVEANSTFIDAVTTRVGRLSIQLWWCLYEGSLFCA